MFDASIWQMLAEGTAETLYMTFASTVFAYLLGLPMGIILVVSAKGGLRPNPVLNKTLDCVVNILRSIPFLILLIMLIPFTRFVLGRAYGSTATIIPPDGGGCSLCGASGGILSA